MIHPHGSGSRGANGCLADALVGWQVRIEAADNNSTAANNHSWTLQSPTHTSKSQSLRYDEGERRKKEKKEKERKKKKERKKERRKKERTFSIQWHKYTSYD